MSQNVVLSHFDRTHLPLLREWLKKPHVLPWYPDVESAIELAEENFATNNQALIRINDQPIGYIRWSFVPKEVLDSIGLTQIPDNAADVDLLIGESQFTSKGLGPRVLELIATEMRKKGDVPVIGLTSSKDNVNAHKAFIKAGYKNVAEYSPDGFGECYLFIFDLRD